MVRALSQWKVGISCGNAPDKQSRDLTRARPKAKPYKFTQQIAVNNDDMVAAEGAAEEYEIEKQKEKLG